MALLERLPRASRSDPAAFACPLTAVHAFIKNVAAMTIAPDMMIVMGVAEVASALVFETSARMANAARAIADVIVALAADALFRKLIAASGGRKTVPAS